MDSAIPEFGHIYSCQQGFCQTQYQNGKKCADPNKTAPYGPPHLDLQFAKVSVLIFRDGRNGFSIICLYIDTSLKLKWSGDKVFKSCKSALTRTPPPPPPPGGLLY